MRAMLSWPAQPARCNLTLKITRLGLLPCRHPRPVLERSPVAKEGNLWDRGLGFRVSGLGFRV